MKPVRREIEARSPYKKYRGELREDFNCACGYCDDSDMRADSISFHIDHFAPKKHFPELEESYLNLVYSCRFCNMRKSDHWVGNDSTIHNDGEKGFIDPCSNDYDDHIERDDATGIIRGKTKLGHYIVKRLNLNLLRHQMLWYARRARALRDEVVNLQVQLKKSPMPDQGDYIKLLERYQLLTEDIDKYELTAVNG